MGQKINKLGQKLNGAKKMAKIKLFNLPQCFVNNELLDFCVPLCVRYKFI